MTRHGVALWAVVVLTLSSCPAKHTPRPIGQFFESMDWVWGSMSPRTVETAPNRALLQLGLPTQSSLSLWHLCPSDAPGCTVEVSTQAGAELIAGVEVASFEGARRIELRGLTPATRYEVRAVTRWNGLASMTRVETLNAATGPATGDSPRFSFVVGSCNETLHVNDKMSDRRPGLHTAHINSLNLLRLRATGKLQIEQLPAQPAFYVGLGDQVYMDAEWDHDEKLRGFALFRGDRSADWAFDASNDPLLMKQLSGEVSRRTFALPPLDVAFRNLPSVLVWDDHELRDGYRNQTDEMGGLWQDWYRAARETYVRDQLLRRPGLDPAAFVSDAGLHSPTHAVFSWGTSAHFFILEGRSAEGDAGSPASTFFGPVQWRAFTDWFAKNTSSDAPPAVLVVGLPAPLATQFGKMSRFLTGEGEARDDLDDQLSASGVDKELAQVLVTIDPARHRLLVVSGDVHTNSATQLSFNGREIGVEIVSSGLAAFREGATFGLQKDVMSASLERPTRIVWDGGALDVVGMGTLRQTTSFSEIVVEPQDAGPPVLRIFFFPSVGNPASAVLAGRVQESYRLTNPVAYLERQTRTWPSRRYDGTGTDAPLVGYLLVGRTEEFQLDGGRICSEKEGVNCLHATASVCVDYETDLRATPYGTTNWWGDVDGGAACRVLKADTCDLDVRLDSGGTCPTPQYSGQEVQEQAQGCTR